MEGKIKEGEIKEGAHTYRRQREEAEREGTYGESGRRKTRRSGMGEKRGAKRGRRT